ncbi:MAG: hypothetical protein RL095_1374 [Verrucomicrobiota bacterium]|jgi:hypothetical protein
MKPDSFSHRHRHSLLFVWCCLPIFAAIYHFSEGQSLLARDVALARLDEAEALPPARHEEAEKLRKQALSGLDPVRHKEERTLVHLRQAQSLWKSSSTSANAAALDEALRHAEQQAALPGADPIWQALASEARSHLIRAQHATAWLMRTQGRSRHDWLRELQVGRQNASYLLDQKSTDAELQFNLEACLWLERVDLKKLKGLPLPENQDPGEGQGQGEGEGEPADDGKPGEGEGKGPPKDGRGTGRRPSGPGS